MKVSLIVAMAEGGVIGRAGALPWRLPADLARFQRVTMGHHLVVGRRTWESIGRALPGRRILVVTHEPGKMMLPASVTAVGSLAEALACAAAAGDDEAFVAGGASLYREALPRADRLYLTRVHATLDGDTTFPSVDLSGWREREREDTPADEHNPYGTTFLALDSPAAAEDASRERSR